MKWRTVVEFTLQYLSALPSAQKTNFLHTAEPTAEGDEDEHREDEYADDDEDLASLAMSVLTYVSKRWQN